MGCGMSTHENGSQNADSENHPNSIVKTLKGDYAHCSSVSHDIVQRQQEYVRRDNQTEVHKIIDTTDPHFASNLAGCDIFHYMEDVQKFQYINDGEEVANEVVGIIKATVDRILPDEPKTYVIIEQEIRNRNLEVPSRKFIKQMNLSVRGLREAPWDCPLGIKDPATLHGVSYPSIDPE